MIPYARQDIIQKDIQAVIEVLQSDWLTQGPCVEQFEQAVAAYCGVKHAVAVNSATSALHIACLAAGLQAGGRLWTSPNTFVASANCGLYCGAQVDFVDIDARTYNISPECLEEKLEASKENGTIPGIVIPVHFAGQACEMETIARLAGKYKFTVIEDASHAIGGSYRGGKIGNCRYSDMTVLSFHPVKIITSAEGGMVLTNRTDLYEKLVQLRSHGITRDPVYMVGESHGPWYYQQIGLGFNYRLTDMQAALGLSQLTRIDEFVARRREIAASYYKELADQPLILPYQHSDTDSAWHLYVVKVQAGKMRKAAFDRLRERGIGVNVHYIPVYTQPYYRNTFGFAENYCPNAVDYYNSCISLPMYYSLSRDEQAYVIQMIKEVLA